MVTSVTETGREEKKNERIYVSFLTKSQLIEIQNCLIVFVILTFQKKIWA